MKLKSWEEIFEIVQNLKASGKKIVFTNGCFDIIHAGHIKYLYEASELGDILIIGLNSDASAKRLKGKNRPINSELDRATVLSSLTVIDYIIIFQEDTPYKLIKHIKPDILVKGGDWKPEEIVGSDIVMKNGGIVKSLIFKEGFSTTDLIEKIKKI
ncbi:MAG: D-glycero-beta-D-manno-heptose 1-phosphate adenylyltransferase [Candidatus Cloacimonetes bacterium]|nr:D-glycero-beta-D-manno-heptose 1-phosphate adenylyltransferase [Candidatus Cloacimonadota bacterium]